MTRFDETLTDIFDILVLKFYKEIHENLSEHDLSRCHRRGGGGFHPILNLLSCLPHATFRFRYPSLNYFIK